MSDFVSIPDGVHALVPYDQMAEPARKLRDTYARKPGIPLFKREFGFYCLERWKEQGLPQGVPFESLFDYDPPGNLMLNHAGGCEAAFSPEFEVKILEDRGEHEVVQDFAGRRVLYFKGRRDGFMPTYLDHPVKDLRTFEENVHWRMDPNSHERFADLEQRMALAKAEAARGLIITQNVVGGYMYLRSLIGPEGLLYTFYDQPELIETCMQAWLTLVDGIIARHQRFVTIDELLLDEDISYKSGSLIAPKFIKRFLFPYYQQLIANLRARQIDRTRHLYIQLDTDGYAAPVIPLYMEGIGLDIFSPCEVAAGCDAIEIGHQYPDLAIFGGIDKRVLAGPQAGIGAYLERLIPPMRRRGGFIPTCDHGVPEEVTLENYLYYRKRCIELGSKEEV
jgi:hypothetical protein